MLEAWTQGQKSITMAHVDVDAGHGGPMCFELREALDTPMSNLYRFADYKRKKSKFYFTRAELDLLLSLYSSRVIAGDWKAYAIDHHSNLAQFSIFNHARGRPLYTIVKRKHAGGQPPTFMVVKECCEIANSNNLATALAVFKRNLKLVSP